MESLGERTFGDKTLLEAIEALDKDRHFDRSGVMKEAVFGWYPPANNPWVNYRKRSNSYKKECLFRPQSKVIGEARGLGVTRTPTCEIKGIGQNLTPKPPSRSASGSAQPPSPPRSAPPPSPTRFHRPATATATYPESRTSDYLHPKRPASSMDQRPGSGMQDFRQGSGSRAGSRPGSRCSSAAQRTGWGVTPPTAQDMHITGTSNPYTENYHPDKPLSDYMKTPPRPPTAHKTKPAKLWAYKLPQTTAHLLKNNNNSSEPVKKQSEQDVHVQTKILYWLHNQHPVTAATPTDSVRAQSAGIMRSKTPDSRQVKSAGRMRPETADPARLSHYHHHHDDTEAENFATAVRSDEDLVYDSDEVNASESGSAEEIREGAEEVKETEEEAKEVARDPSPPPLDYDEQLEKYGWKFQIPGDPLGLKTPCLPKRAAYTARCKTPVTRPDPPKTFSENYDTFFLNTIPRKPMSFDIHAEFASEMLHAKRMELQKRDGGVAYRYKDFSFVY